MDDKSVRGQKPQKQSKRDRVKAAVKPIAKKLAKKAEQLHIRKKLRAAKQPANVHSVKENRLELLFTIVNRNKAEYYVDFLHSFDVNMQVIALGHGTADASMMAYFGFDDLDKAVIVSVIKASKINEALSALEDKFARIKNGKGIAYTVPIDGVIGTLIFGFLSDDRKNVKDAAAADKENKQ